MSKKNLNFDTIVLTGGGTAGHVMPNLALVSELKKHYKKICYIGTNGMEKDIVKKYNLPFYEISATKFVRKISFKTFLIPFKLIQSIFEAKKVLASIMPGVVFSKGGYASVPVCIAAKMLSIPVISHESDLSMGLGNKIIYKVAKYMLTSFKETAEGKAKCLFVGNPVREEIFLGDKNRAIKSANFDENKPTLLFMGGSLGASKINEFVYENLEELLKKYNILHITGKNGKKIAKKGYKSVEFTDSIADFFAAADICISRSGANTIFELLALNKPMILIPLPKGNSRGDQVENADNFQKNGFCRVIYQENLDINRLNNAVKKTLENKQVYIKNMQKYALDDVNKRIVDLIVKSMK